MADEATVVREYRVRVARPAEEVFAWHARPGAFKRLLPPWEKVDVLHAPAGLQAGTRAVVRVRLGPVSVPWIAEHRAVGPGLTFRDVQVEGPFAWWEHTHQVEAEGADVAVLVDRLEYALPGGALARPLQALVTRRLDRMFRYRHAVMRADLERALPRTGRVLISGASGLLGRALGAYLQSQGWHVDRLVRRAPEAPDEVAWDPEAGAVAFGDRPPYQAVVHLAGANLAAGRWTESRKRELIQSRVRPTRALVQALLQQSWRPDVLIGASAIGYYGDAGEAEQRETDPPGAGFLAGLCRDWEAELSPAEAGGIRTVALRTGVVLTPEGGALQRLLPVFQWGLGGRLGTGRQWMSWIALDDWLELCGRAVADPAWIGPLNAVAPAPVRNEEFAGTLAAVLGRPSLLPVPAGALRLALGEMADAALLTGARVVPAAALAQGYRFRWPQLEPALRHMLGRGAAASVAGTTDRPA